MPLTENAKVYFLTLGLAFVALYLALTLHLLPALLAGFLIYQLVEFGSRMLGKVGVIPAMGKIILLVVVSLLVITGLALAMVAVVGRITEGPESFVALIQRMADVVVAGRDYLPLWAQEHLPANIDEWQLAAGDWLLENARDLSIFGKEAGVFLLHLVVGMIIGGMVALNPAFQNVQGAFGGELRQRVVNFGTAFRRIVFSQIRISALNTFLTAIFLAGVLPLTGNPLPLTKTMIAVTFMVGLLPIIGNLISNTVIFLISLSVSPVAAVATLIYLVIIHKLEYFVNARIIGSQIRARAWEILLSMVVMEAAFGVAGVVAAPIYYAYLKDELTARKLI